jgi:hypothetical protein
MALKEADKPQIVTPMEKSDADGPVTIELPPEEGEQSAALVAEHDARHRSVSHSPKPTLPNSSGSRRSCCIVTNNSRNLQKLDASNDRCGRRSRSRRGGDAAHRHRGEPATPELAPLEDVAALVPMIPCSYCNRVKLPRGDRPLLFLAAFHLYA